MLLNSFLLITVINNFGHYNVEAVFGVRKHSIMQNPPKGINFVGKRVSVNQYFDQKIDHFNTSDNRTWKQVCFEILSLI